MPPIVDLHRIGNRSAYRFRVSARAVSTHDLDARVLAKPRFECVDAAAGQDVDAFTGFGVD